jgi:hypothetical protein
MSNKKELTQVQMETYGWSSEIGKQGRPQRVNKEELLIDYSYQRQPIDGRVMMIASKFSWALFGELLVHDRKGKLYIVDGQHRWLAALKRPDVSTVPCLVFDSPEEAARAAEARVFVGRNTSTRAADGLSRYRGMLVSRDPAAVRVHALMESTGHSIGRGGGVPGEMIQKQVRCVSLLLKLCAADASHAALQRVWPLIVQISVEAHLPIHDALVKGCSYLEWHGEVSLTRDPWRERVLKCGMPTLLRHANSMAAALGHASARSLAWGMWNAINKGVHHKFPMREGRAFGDAGDRDLTHLRQRVLPARPDA